MIANSCTNIWNSSILWFCFFSTLQLHTQVINFYTFFRSHAFLLFSCRRARIFVTHWLVRVLITSFVLTNEFHRLYVRSGHFEFEQFALLFSFDSILSSYSNPETKIFVWYDFCRNCTVFIIRIPNAARNLCKGFANLKKNRLRSW